MTDMATTVANVRRILNDAPVEDYLNNGSALTAAATTVVVANVGLWSVGQVWEVQGVGTTSYECWLVRAVDTSSSTITIKRGHEGTTAATSTPDGTVVWLSPSYRFDTVALAVTDVVDAELFNNGVYDIQKHQITSSATNIYYNAPTTGCEEFLYVYQQIQATDPPTTMRSWDRLPIDVDTSLYGNGKAFRIVDNIGDPGTDVYYVNCKHKLTLATLTALEEKAVWYLAAATTLEWSEARRVQGPANQGDRTVGTAAAIQTGAYYRLKGQNLLADCRAYLKALNPGFRTFRKEN